MGAYSLASSSAFWLSLFGCAWLALDPVVKCTFVVVYQHLRSRREGDDLRGLLASLPSQQQKKAEMIASAGDGRGAGIASLVMLAVILLSPSQATARSTQAPPSHSAAETAADSTRQVRVQELRQALDKESQRAIYRWHDTEHPSPPTWFDKMLDKIGDAIKNALGRLLEIPAESLAAWAEFLAVGGWWVAAEGSPIMAGADGGVDLGGGCGAILASPTPRARRRFPFPSLQRRCPI